MSCSSVQDIGGGGGGRVVVVMEEDIVNQALHAARETAANEAFLPTDHESSFSSGQQRPGEERVLEQAHCNGGGSLERAATMPQAGPASCVQSSAQQQQQQQVQHHQQQKHFAVKTKPPSPHGEEHRAGSPRTKEWSGLCAENHPPQSTTLSLQIEAKSCAWNRHTKQYEIKRGHLQHIRIEGGDAIVKGGDFLTVRVAHRFKNDRIRNKIRNCGLRLHANKRIEQSVVDFPDNTVLLREYGGDIAIKVLLKEGQADVPFVVHCLGTDRSNQGHQETFRKWSLLVEGAVGGGSVSINEQIDFQSMTAIRSPDRLKKRKSEPDAGPPLTSVIKTEPDLGQQLEHDKKWREFTNFAIPLLSTLGPRQQDLALDSMKSLLANFAEMAALSSNSGDDENRGG